MESGPGCKCVSSAFISHLDVRKGIDVRTSYANLVRCWCRCNVGGSTWGAHEATFASETEDGISQAQQVAIEKLRFVLLLLLEKALPQGCRVPSQNHSVQDYVDADIILCMIM